MSCRERDKKKKKTIETQGEETLRERRGAGTPAGGKEKKGLAGEELPKKQVSSRERGKKKGSGAAVISKPLFVARMIAKFKKKKR